MQPIPSNSFTLDVRDKICPLTFAYAKFFVEELEAGQCATIYYPTSEAAKLPKSLSQLDIEIIDVMRLPQEQGFSLQLQKKA